MSTKSALRGSVDIRGVAKSYDGAPALRGVDLAIAPGEFVSLLGPSGCGKTTLLRCIAGLVPVDAGDIRVDDRSLLSTPAWKRDVSVVFQSYALFPHMSVEENVAFGLRMRRLNKPEIERKVGSALALVQMSAFKGRRPAQLSGGQQQRVALARAIVVEPTVLLLDEPLAALDAKLRSSVQLEIKALQRRLGVTTILVTHDQAEAMVMSDRVAVMNNGAIEQFSTPIELYNHPSNPYVADFVGETNRIVGDIIEDYGNRFIAIGRHRYPVPNDIREVSGTVLIRPEGLHIDTLGNTRSTLEAAVTNIVLIGDRISIFLDAGGIPLKSTVLNSMEGIDTLPSIGARVGLRWDHTSAMIFPGRV